jgi:hypothetical protein
VPSRKFKVLSLSVGFLLLMLPGWRLMAQQNENIFGIVEGFWLPDVTCDLHPGWERIIFDWSQHQPNGPDDWNTLNVDDRWLKAASACGREVVALIKHTPAWATDGTPGPGVPRGLDLPIDDPNNVWAAFMRRTAEYYVSRGINHYIIWNEPDISSDTYGFEFEGTVDDYFQMLKVAALVVKAANPAAVIHLAGTTYWHDVNAGRRVYIDRLLERIQQDPDAAQNGYYFDVLSLHIYFRTDSVYDIVRTMRQLLDQYGLQDKTIWINETNAAPTDDPKWPVVRPVYQLNLDQQAAFLVQAAALGLAGGAERIAVYKLYDQQLPSGGESFGILSPADQSPRSAFHAWRMVIGYLNGVEQAALAQTLTVDVVKLTHADGRQTFIAWARTDQPTEIELSASGEKAHFVDQYGNITLVRPQDGHYRLSLPGATCNEQDGCAVGGDVSLVIQPTVETAALITVHEIPAADRVTLNFK